MSQIIIIKSKFDGSVIATSDKVTNLEGNYYFDKSEVNFDLLTKKDSMYTCPIKRATYDYYYLNLDTDREIGWCYKTIPSSLFENIAGKIGFYARENDLTEIVINEKNN
jgi:uncharacterized protein (DUF427 family)